MHNTKATRLSAEPDFLTPSDVLTEDWNRPHESAPFSLPRMFPPVKKSAATDIPDCVHLDAKFRAPKSSSKTNGTANTFNPTQTSKKRAKESATTPAANTSMNAATAEKEAPAHARVSSGPKSKPSDSVKESQRPYPKLGKSILSGLSDPVIPSSAMPQPTATPPLQKAFKPDSPFGEGYSGSEDHPAKKKRKQVSSTLCDYLKRVRRSLSTDGSSTAFETIPDDSDDEGKYRRPFASTVRSEGSRSETLPPTPKSQAPTPERKNARSTFPSTPPASVQEKKGRKRKAEADKENDDGTTTDLRSLGQSSRPAKKAKEEHTVSDNNNKNKKNNNNNNDITKPLDGPDFPKLPFNPINEAANVEELVETLKQVPKILTDLHEQYHMAISVLSKRINVQHAQLFTQKDRLDEQEEKLQAQEEKLQTQEHKIQAQERKLKSLQTDIVNVEASHFRTRAAFQKLKRDRSQSGNEESV